MPSGGSSSATGRTANYHMSVHYGICSTVDSINAVYVNDTLIPEMETEGGGKIPNGRMTVNGTLICRQELLFGGWPKQGGLSGHIDFMMGRPDQPVNGELCQRLKVDPNRAPAFRGIASVFFRDAISGYGLGPQKGFLWSSNMPSLPPVAVQVTRIPFGPNGVKRDRGGHANPAHIIFECLSDTDWGMGSPVGLIDLTSFDHCADQLDAEGFFLSLMWARSATIEAFVGEILDHIQATLTTDPATGKLKLKLLRDDYSHVPGELHIVHPGNATMIKMQRKVWGETINDISVTWTNPLNEEEETVNAQDNGNIALQGAVVSTTRNYYGVRDANLALALAYRDLRQSGTPLLAIECTVDRSMWAHIVGDVVEVRWPEYGISSIIMRIGSINYGKSDDSTININLMEDIFGLGTAIFGEIPVAKPGDPAPTYPPPAPGVDIPPYIPPHIPVPQAPLDPEVGEAPTALTYSYLDSMPYFIMATSQGDTTAQSHQYPESAGLILANQPGTATSVIEVWSNMPTITGDIELKRLARLPNAGRGNLGAAISATQTDIPFPANWFGEGLTAGKLLLVTHGTADSQVQELMVIRSVGGTLSVIRGALDTNAYAWDASAPVWLLNPNGMAIDPVTRSDGEIVTYKFAPITNQGTFPPSQSADFTHEINERMHQPYRPVGLTKIGTDVLPLSLSWRRRNRLMETAQVFEQSYQDVTPEGGQVTRLVFSGPGSSETRVVNGITGTTYDLTIEDTAMARNGILNVSAFAVRGQFVSRVSADISFAVSLTGYGVRYGTRYGN